MEQRTGEPVDDDYGDSRIRRLTLIALGTVFFVGITIIGMPKKQIPEWQRVLPGAEWVILDEVNVRNTAPVRSPGENELELGYRQEIDRIELNFRSQPGERMNFELGFDFEKFGFRPTLTNATLSVGEQNHVSIATIEPREEPQALQVTLTRKK